jgi:hypothetical protein
MRRKTIVLVVAMIFLVPAMAVIALASDPLVGTWKMNPAKSKFSSHPLRSFTTTFTAQDNGIKAIEAMINADGTTLHRSWAAKYDGKEYPVTASDIDTIVLKKPNPNTVDYVCKKSGKKALSGRVVVSKNGKTMTDTGGGKDANRQAFTWSNFMEKQ